MGRLAAVLLLALGAAACQQASSPPTPAPSSNGYSLTTEQVNHFLTACRAQRSELPWEVTNALCSCLIREFPRSVPREDAEALGRETDPTRAHQLMYGNGPMRHVMKVCFVEALEGPATSSQQAGSPPAPLPNGGYTLTITERNQFLPACSGSSSKLPSEFAIPFCSCIIREIPRWVSREDLAAIGRETDETKILRAILKSRPLRHVGAMCISEALDGLAAPN